MISLYSCQYKQLANAHKYKSAESHKYDVVSFVMPSNIIKTFVINKQAEEIVQVHALPYLVKLQNLMQSMYPNTPWNLHRFESFIVEDNENVLRFYGFLFIQDLNENIYVFKLECFNLLENNIEITITPIDCLMKQSYKIAGLLLKEDLIYNDYETIDTVHVYIMYIEYDNKTLSGKPVLGRRVLVTDKEKEQFFNRYNISPVYTDSLVIDCIGQPIYLYRLPDNTEDVQFQFTNGLLYLRFDEPDEVAHEKFKV